MYAVAERFYTRSVYGIWNISTTWRTREPEGTNMSDENERFCSLCGVWLQPVKFFHPLIDDEQQTIAGIRIAPAQWRLLTALRKKPGGWLSREMLLNTVAKKEDATLGMISVVACRLRQAIVGLPFSIESRQGWGYMLKVPDDRQ
jgi:hypothetical protein